MAVDANMERRSENIIISQQVTSLASAQTVGATFTVYDPSSAALEVITRCLSSFPAFFVFFASVPFVGIVDGPALRCVQNMVGTRSFRLLVTQSSW